MKNYTDEQLKALNAWDWVKILKGNPELANKYDRLNFSSYKGMCSADKISAKTPNPLIRA